MTVTFYFARHGETLFNVQGKIQGWCDSPLTSSGMYDAYKLGQGLASIDFVGAYASDSGRASTTLSLALEARDNERSRNSAQLAHAIKSIAATHMDLPFSLADMTDSRVIADVEDHMRQAGHLQPGALDQKRAGSQGSEMDSKAEAGDLDPNIRLAPGFLSVAQRSEPIRITQDPRLREWSFGDLEEQKGVVLHDRLLNLFGRETTRVEQNERLDEIADYLASADTLNKAEDFASIAARIEEFLQEQGALIEARGGGNVLAVTHAMLIRAMVFMYDRDRVNNPVHYENASITEVIWDQGTIRIGKIGYTL